MPDIQRDPARLRATFSSDLTNVDSVCTAVQQLLAEHGHPSHFPSKLVLRELLNNAVRHGNRGNHDKTVECTVRITTDSILIDVTDEGEGFAWRERFPPPDDETSVLDDEGQLPTSSYGMKILVHYTSNVEFNDKGNRVAVCIDRYPKGGAAMFSVQKEGQQAVLRPAVNIVASEIDVLRTEFKQLLAEGVMELIIDLSDVQMIDSMGLGVLISAHNSLKKAGGTLSVINASKELYNLFRSMRLTQHFSVTSA